MRLGTLLASSTTTDFKSHHHVAVKGARNLVITATGGDLPIDGIIVR
jgi:hypothetical protein